MRLVDILGRDSPEEWPRFFTFAPLEIEISISGLFGHFPDLDVKENDRAARGMCNLARAWSPPAAPPDVANDAAGIVAGAPESQLKIYIEICIYSA